MFRRIQKKNQYILLQEASAGTIENEALQNQNPDSERKVAG